MGLSVFRINLSDYSLFLEGFIFAPAAIQIVASSFVAFPVIAKRSLVNLLSAVCLFVSKVKVVFCAHLKGSAVFGKVIDGQPAEHLGILTYLEVLYSSPTSRFLPKAIKNL